MKNSTHTNHIARHAGLALPPLPWTTTQAARGIIAFVTRAKRIRAKHLSVLLAATLTLTLAACGSEPAEESAQPQAGVTADIAKRIDEEKAHKEQTEKTIPGLSAAQVADDDPNRPISVKYPQLNTYKPFNDWISKQAEQTAETFRSDNPAKGGVAAPELTQNWRLLAASGTTVGIQLETYTFSGASGSTESRTVWVDSANNQPQQGPALLTPEGQTEVRKRIIEAIKKTGAAANGPDPQHTEAVIAGTSFTPAGDLHIIVSQGMVTSYSEGRFEVTLQGDPTSKLTPLGQAARKASLQGAPGFTEPAGSKPAAPATTAAPAPKTDCNVEKCVALTFDDGPGPGTHKVLDALDAHQAKGTFFILGEHAPLHPDALKRMAAEGHELGNHTLDHKLLTKLTPEEQRREIETTTETIKRITGQAPKTFRPPYGAYNKDTRAVKIPIILWNVDTQDWKTRSTAKTVESAVNSARPGAVILMHDIHDSTVQAVPEIVQKLTEKGFKLVTVSELGGEKVRPGETFSGR
ncbi:polysaccharide deacetylase family protein [Dermatophilus congolensis]|uniref:polysaccharide deacetylase family protein n=1 Tax=Dermatophilus congolensis TaxID=1863 RepID=UPI000687335C|nr:polysaccharide deacetylase family protein [Dermatophilus congolensis]